MGGWWFRRRKKSKEGGLKSGWMSQERSFAELEDPDEKVPGRWMSGYGFGRSSTLGPTSWPEKSYFGKRRVRFSPTCLAAVLVDTLKILTLSSVSFWTRLSQIPSLPASRRFLNSSTLHPPRCDLLLSTRTTTLSTTLFLQPDPSTLQLLSLLSRRRGRTRFLGNPSLLVTLSPSLEFPAPPDPSIERILVPQADIPSSRSQEQQEEEEQHPRRTRRSTTPAVPDPQSTTIIFPSPQLIEAR